MSTPIIKAMETLRNEGWFTEFNLPCCQSCAWSSIPHEHQKGPFQGQLIDLDKVLFNHEQDMEDFDNMEDCPECLGDGYIELEDDEIEDCDYCDGSGIENLSYLKPEDVSDTLFCHSGGPNMERAIEVFEEHGCKVGWILGQDHVRFSVSY